MTVASSTGQGAGFAWALAEALAEAGRRVTVIGRVRASGAGAVPTSVHELAVAHADTDVAAVLRSAAADCDLLVVADPALTQQVCGMLDVWIGPRPLPDRDAEMFPVHASCQLEVRSSAQAVARILAENLTGLVARSPAAEAG